IPSGIDGRTGNILGIAVQANETVTFATGKPGLYLADGRDATGEISVVDIGIPVQLIAEDDGLTCLMDTAMAAKALPERRPNSHKYTYGHVLVVAGSHAMPGAGRLVSEAALQSGCGLVTLAAPPQVLQSVGLLPEILHAPLTANPAGHSQPAALEALLNDTERMAKVSVVAIGPGLGKDDDTAACLQLLLTHTAMAGKVLIVDADALHLLAAKPVPTKERTPAALILTPHLGEARALLSGNLPADLITTATTIAQRYEAIAVLKTAGTITAGPGGRTIINPTGNPGMATAGSGDVLTGILSGLLAQTVASGAVTPERLFSTVALGVYLHGLAGDAAADETTPYCLIASDITAGLPQAFEAVLSARTQPRSLEAHR
ncbi:MAG: NAD(P)H-hydrate dehydratase, partial [Candidatus Melainabacteria bacterium]